MTAEISMGPIYAVYKTCLFGKDKRIQSSQEIIKAGFQV